MISDPKLNKLMIHPLLALMYLKSNAYRLAMDIIDAEGDIYNTIISKDDIMLRKRKAIVIEFNIDYNTMHEDTGFVFPAKCSNIYLIDTDRKCTYLVLSADLCNFQWGIDESNKSYIVAIIIPCGKKYDHASPILGFVLTRRDGMLGFRKLVPYNVSKYISKHGIKSTLYMRNNVIVCFDGYVLQSNRTIDIYSIFYPKVLNESIGDELVRSTIQVPDKYGELVTIAEYDYFGGGIIITGKKIISRTTLYF